MYKLTKDDIKELTKPSPWRDWLSSGDTRPFEEYFIDWKKQHAETYKG
jgi:hypothetical protein